MPGGCVWRSCTPAVAIDERMTVRAVTTVTMGRILASSFDQWLAALDERHLANLTRVGRRSGERLLALEQPSELAQRLLNLSYFLTAFRRL